MEITNKQLDEFVDGCADIATERIMELQVINAELLAACEGLLYDFSTIIQLVRNGYGIERFPFDAQGKAQAAIAKAKRRIGL